MASLEVRQALKWINCLILLSITWVAISICSMGVAIHNRYDRMKLREEVHEDHGLIWKELKRIVKETGIDEEIR